MAEPLDTQRMLQWKLAGILERHVERIFKPGTKLTIIARTPGNNEADVLVTNDKLPELAKLIERSKAREELPVGAVLERTAGVGGNDGR